MNKNLTILRIKSEREEIIKMYIKNIPIAEIAEEYGVISTSIWRHLRRWGVPIKQKPRAPYHYRDKKIKMAKRTFSPELQAKMKENTKINNKYIKFYNTVDTGKDKFLVRNILRKSRAVADE